AHGEHHVLQTELGDARIAVRLPQVELRTQGGGDRLQLSRDQCDLPKPCHLRPSCPAVDGRRPRGMMFAPSGADPALPVGGANMSEPQDAASESSSQTVMPGHGWPAPEGNDV